jgi:hypothetical protein
MGRTEFNYKQSKLRRRNRRRSTKKKKIKKITSKGISDYACNLATNLKKWHCRKVEREQLEIYREK